jgi:hypothetical protein
MEKWWPVIKTANIKPEMQDGQPRLSKPTREIPAYKKGF